MVKAACFGLTTQPDLSIVCARFNDQTVEFTPTGYNKHDAPLYQLDMPRAGRKAQSPTSSGGDQALTDSEGWTIHTNAPAPFSPNGLGGTFRGTPRWSYPSVWPGLHASHEAAVPDRPGMMIGTTRLLGGWIQPPGEAGPMFGINANMGNMYLFTADGLFVATLFNDIRLRPNWAMPTATRGMDVSNVSLHDENFWPSITQTVSQGEVFVVDGARAISLVRDRRARFDPSNCGHSGTQVTADDLGKALPSGSIWREARRQAAQGSGTLRSSSCGGLLQKSMASSTIGRRPPIGQRSTAAALPPTSTAIHVPIAPRAALAVARRQALSNT